MKFPVYRPTFCAMIACRHAHNWHRADGCAVEDCTCVAFAAPDAPEPAPEAVSPVTAARDSLYALAVCGDDTTAEARIDAYRDAVLADEREQSAAERDRLAGELAGARATIAHMSKAMSWICGHDRQGLDHLEEAQREAKARLSAVKEAKRWAKQARAAVEDVKKWMAFIERGFTTHMSFGVLNSDGSTEQLPCADWCYACRLEQAEAALARVHRLADDWAMLRTHGGAAYELRAVLDPLAAYTASVGPRAGGPVRFDHPVWELWRALTGEALTNDTARDLIGRYYDAVTSAPAAPVESGSDDEEPRACTGGAAIDHDETGICNHPGALDGRDGL